jgi:hypothetical protein
MSDTNANSESAQEGLAKIQVKVLRQAERYQKLGMIAEALGLMEEQFSQPTPPALDFLTGLLEDKVNTDKALVEANADKVLKLVRLWRVALGGLAADEKAKPSVGAFLVAALRCVNFANHNSKLVLEFYNIMKQCSFTVVGDPEKCINAASFADLAYSPYTKEIRMTP